MPRCADVRPLTAVGLIQARAAAKPDEVSSWYRREATWVPVTCVEEWLDVRRAAAALRGLGLRAGDRLAIMSRTCREWQIAEFGAQLIGAVVVGVDAHAAPDQAAAIVAGAGAVALLADTEQTLARLSPDIRDTMRFVSLFRPQGTTAGRTTAWSDVVGSARALAGDCPLPEPEAAAVVIHTSGTTGAPKAIVYTHRQVMTAAWAMIDAYRDLADGRLVCWLPMAPLFQRMMNLVGCGHRSAIYYVEDPRELIARLPEIRPTALTSVPRFYEKLHDGIREQLRARPTWLRNLANRALADGLARWQLVRNGRPLPVGLRLRHALLDFVVLRKMRRVLGGSIRALISGSAGMAPWLLDFYYALGLPVLEAYGVSESPIPVAGNTPGVVRVGSVGQPFPQNTVRISSEGEVLVKGPALFRGYEGGVSGRDPFTPDGFYRTGDQGHLDDDGFLFLTGRLSDVIKTSSGRQVSPARIESLLMQSPFIEQIVVVGHNRPHLGALVVLNQAAITAACGVGAGLAAAKSTVCADMDRLSASLPSYERPRVVAILPRPLDVEHGELTPTLKLRRARIEALHRSLIDEMFAESTPLAVGL